MYRSRLVGNLELNLKYGLEETLLTSFSCDRLLQSTYPLCYRRLMYFPACAFHVNESKQNVCFYAKPVNVEIFGYM